MQRDLIGTKEGKQCLYMTSSLLQMYPGHYPAGPRNIHLPPVRHYENPSLPPRLRAKRERSMYRQMSQLQMSYRFPPNFNQYPLIPMHTYIPINAATHSQVHIHNPDVAQFSGAPIITGSRSQGPYYSPALSGRKQRPSKRARQKVRRRIERQKLEQEKHQEALISPESGYETTGDPAAVVSGTMQSSPEEATAATGEEVEDMPTEVSGSSFKAVASAAGGMIMWLQNAASKHI